MGVIKQGKRDKFSSVKPDIFTDRPSRHKKFFIWGAVMELVIYSKFHENRLRSLGATKVENRDLPLKRPMAYTTAAIRITGLATVSNILATKTRIFAYNQYCRTDVHELILT